MADIIKFPPTLQDTKQDLRARHRTGNGAREAVMQVAGYSDDPGDVELRADCFLAELWALGFKIVPLEPADGY